MENEIQVCLRPTDRYRMNIYLVTHFYNILLRKRITSLSRCVLLSSKRNVILMIKLNKIWRIIKPKTIELVWCKQNGKTCKIMAVKDLTILIVDFTKLQWSRSNLERTKLTRRRIIRSVQAGKKFVQLLQCKQIWSLVICHDITHLL